MERSVRLGRTSRPVLTALTIVVMLLAGLVVTGPGTALASPAAFTGINTDSSPPGDGAVNQCLNGPPNNPVNCNLYIGKKYVWMNAGPVEASLGAGTYFFAVLSPSGQQDPNDTSPQNLSVLANNSCTNSTVGDPVSNRTFTVNSSGTITAYTGTHDFDTTNNMIRLSDGSGGCNPYGTTTNNGGVYILAICSLAHGYPVRPQDCKYDAFKVNQTPPTTANTVVLSGYKYYDRGTTGCMDQTADTNLPCYGTTADTGIAGWPITITCTSNSTTVYSNTINTGAGGAWSVNINLPQDGNSTTCQIAEVQKTGWKQTGNTVSQITTINATSAQLNSPQMTYTVTVPDDANSSVAMLNFGNIVSSISCSLGAGIKFNSQTNQAHPQVTGIPITSSVATTFNDSITNVWLTQSNSNVSVESPFASPYNSNNAVAGLFVVGSPPNVQPLASTVVNGQIQNAPVTAGSINGALVYQQSPSTGISGSVLFEDQYGNFINCDPAMSTPIRSAGQPESLNVIGVGQADHVVQVQNGAPGVQNLTVTVNGQAFSLHGLAGGQNAGLDIAGALHAGDNSVTVTTTGQPGGSAILIFSNF